VKLAVVVLLLLLAGCGSGGDAPDAARPVEQHLRALSEGDYGGACAQLTADAQGDVIGLVAHAGGPRPGSCADAYRSLVATGSLDFARAGVMDLSRAQRIGSSALSVEVDSVKGAHAEAHVSGSSKAISLSHGPDGWKIARLDFTDLP
jgi:hypothetical protein